MYTPILLVLMLIGNIFGWDMQDGFAMYMQRGLPIAAMIYTLIAIVLIYNKLEKIYSKSSATFTSICLLYGTMLIEYCTAESSFSHAYGFFSCTMFLIYVEYYEKNYDFSKKKMIMDLGLGLWLGLCFLVRNTNLLIGFIYLCYNAKGLKDIAIRLQKRILKPKIITQIIGFTLLFMVQLVCYRIMSGDWILYSYSGETFANWSHPLVYKVLFSEAKGLLVFSPVLVIGIAALFVEKYNMKLAYIIIFISITYVISAWWCWYLGCSYSERMYCDYIGIFALPMCSFYDGLERQKNKFVGSIIYANAILFVILNMIWIRSTHYHIIANNLVVWHMFRDVLNQVLY